MTIDRLVSDATHPNGPARCAESTVEGTKGTIALRGEIDDSNAEQLRQVVDDLLATGVTTVVADFRAVTFFDSSCLGVLVYAHRALGERGGTLTVVNTSAYGRKIFRITGLASLLDVED